VATAFAEQAAEVNVLFEDVLVDVVD